MSAAEKLQVTTNQNHQFIEGNGFITLKLIGLCDAVEVERAQTRFGELTAARGLPLIVNCESSSFLSMDWIRFLLRTQNELKKQNLLVRFINVQPSISALFKKSGVDEAFKISRDLRSALVEMGLVTGKRLDTDFINPFLEATLTVLKVQARTDSVPGKIYLKKAGEQFTGDISGVIGIVSESFTGSVVISFPEKTFLSVMNSMLSENHVEVTSEIIDGAGEITNQVFGMAKVKLNDKGYGIKTAIPSVVSGKDHSLTSLSHGPTVVIPFTTKDGNFFVEICLSD